MHGGVEELSVDRFCCDISAAGGNVSTVWSISTTTSTESLGRRRLRSAHGCGCGVGNHGVAPGAICRAFDGLVSDVGNGRVCFERGQCRRCEPDGWHGDEHVLPIRIVSRPLHRPRVRVRVRGDRSRHGARRQYPLRPELKSDAEQTMDQQTAEDECRCRPGPCTEAPEQEHQGEHNRWQANPGRIAAPAGVPVEMGAEHSTGDPPRRIERDG